MKLGEGDGVKKSLLKLLGGIAGLTLSASIFAVGMGGISVTSGLGQALNAEVELVAVSKAEKASLVARLASPEVYKGAGLDYPYGNKFKFQIESRENGEPYLKVTSAQPINDPFVVMLVELTWSAGKLLREYTFLLDPPGYVAELPPQAAVQPVAPAVQSAPVFQSAPAGMEAMPDAPPTPPEVVKSVQQSELAATSPPAPGVASTPVPAPAAAFEDKSAMAATAVPDNIAMGSIAAPNEEWLAVQRGDTLGKISAQYKSANVSLERMLVALYRANADEFDGRNMNRIKAGKILRLPTQREVEVVGQYEAQREIHAQVADWNVYRQRLAGAASMSSKPQAAEQVATGKLASSVADKTPVAKESAKEVLKLSKGEAPGDQAAMGAGGKSMTAQDKKSAAQEEAIAKDKAAKDDQARIAVLEKNLQEMQRLMQLKTQAAALAQQPPVAPAPASAMPATSGVKPAPVAKPKPQPVKQEPTLVDQMLALLDQALGEPVYLAGGAGALVVLGGLGWFIKRRKKKPFFEYLKKFSKDEGSESGHIAEPVAPSPENGDFTGMFPTPEANEESHDADPISEADLFLNFGRDAQAEEILKEALQNTPNNHRIHLKLLEIYVNRKDLNSFATIARQLQESGDEEASQKAIAMGRELDPSNPMYGGTGTKENTGSFQAPVFDAMPRLVSGDASSPKSSGVDFNLDVPSAKSASAPEHDFMTGAGQTVVMLSPDLEAKPSGEMDFDVTSMAAPAQAAPGEQAQSAMHDLGDLIFDVTGSQPAADQEAEAALPKSDDMTLNAPISHPSMEAPQAEPAPAKADDGMMEFSMDFPVQNKAEKLSPAAQQAEVALAGISLNFDDAPAPAAQATDGTDEHWQEVATKLDLAKAYQEMGDATGAREILEEVLREGDDGQREVAQSLLAQLG